MGGEILLLNRRTAFQTVMLEYTRGKGNSRCKGEICRYLEEHQRRRRFSGVLLTLNAKARGANRIRYSGSPSRKR